MKKLLALAADGMAGSLDLSMGALIVFVTAKAIGTEPLWWHLLVGSFFAFLPDLDLLIQLHKKGLEAATGDHRVTVIHRPLVILPLCTIAVLIVGGTYWAIVVFLCLTWHYAHDSAWLGSVGDIDWFWPITNRTLPYMDHPAWREKFWLRPTNLSTTELAAGILIVAILTNHYLGLLSAIVTVIILMFGACVVWLLAFDPQGKRLG